MYFFLVRRLGSVSFGEKKKKCVFLEQWFLKIKKTHTHLARRKGTNRNEMGPFVSLWDEKLRFRKINISPWNNLQSRSNTSQIYKHQRSVSNKRSSYWHSCQQHLSAWCLSGDGGQIHTRRQILVLPNEDVKTDHACERLWFTKKTCFERKPEPAAKGLLSKG